MRRSSTICWGIDDDETFALLGGNSPASTSSAAGLAAISQACAEAGVVPTALEDVWGASPEASHALGAPPNIDGLTLTRIATKAMSMLAELVPAMQRMPQPVMRHQRRRDRRWNVVLPACGSDGASGVSRIQ